MSTELGDVAKACMHHICVSFVPYVNRDALRRSSFNHVQSIKDTMVLQPLYQYTPTPVAFTLPTLDKVKVLDNNAVTIPPR